MASERKGRALPYVLAVVHMPPFVLLDVDHPDAAALLDQSGDLFSSFDWVRMVRDTYGLTVRIAVDTDAGVVLPLARLDDLAGRRLNAFPFTDYLQPAGGGEDMRRLAEWVTAREPNFAITVNGALGETQTWINAGWSLQKQAVYHRIPITSQEALWSGMSVKFRNQVRQAQRNGVTVSIDDTPEGVDRFFTIHSELRSRKFASIPQPRRFFHAIRDRFNPQGRYFGVEARHEGVLCAACIAIACGGKLYYKFSASTLGGLPLRANNLMLWELLCLAMREGYGELDLGRTGLGDSYSGLRQFKEGLGGQPFPISVFARTARTSDDAVAARADAFRSLANQIVEAVARHKSSEDLNDRMGELLYRYFT